ncbi:hypothetical protein [Tissierella praeacuta]|uniref:hypothetical protein n=1 Tax=Tissierella praeacuta TaxID=43131 RepID=UPI00333EAE47
MGLNKKALKIGIFTISLSLVISIGVAMFMKLDKPVFFKNYVETMFDISNNSYKERELILKYLTNVSDNRRITDIYFEEYPNLVAYAGNSSSMRDIFPVFLRGNNFREEVYGRYIFRNLYVTIDVRSLGEFDEIELNKAKITFDNGEVMDIDLGRIIFYNYYKDNNDCESKHLKSLSSTSSSDGTSSVIIDVKEDITITNMESPLLKDVNDLIEIKVGDISYTDISEVQYKNNDVIRIKSAFRQPKKNILEKFALYSLEPKLYYRDSNGDLFYSRVYNIEYTNYNINTWEIVKYLRARGEI